MQTLLLVLLLILVCCKMIPFASQSRSKHLAKPMNNKTRKELYKSFHKIVEYQHPALYREKPELAKDLVESWVSCFLYLYDQSRVLNTRDKYEQFKRKTYKDILSWANYHYYRGNPKMNDIAYDNFVANKGMKSLHPNSKKNVNTVYNSTQYNQILSSSEYIQNDTELLNVQWQIMKLRGTLLRLHSQTKDNIDYVIKNEPIWLQTNKDQIEIMTFRSKLFRNDKTAGVMSKEKYDKKRHYCGHTHTDIARKYYYNNRPFFTDKYYDLLKNNLHAKPLHPETINKLGI